MDAVISARLKDAHFTLFKTEVNSELIGTTDGVLKIEVNHGLNDPTPNAPNEILAQVTMTITGTPKDSHDEERFAFRIKLQGIGLYEWPKDKPMPDVTQDNVNRLLCQSIYVMVVAEAGQIAKKLSIGSIRLPWDITLSDMKEAPEKKEPKKPGIRKVARKAPVGKKTA